MKTPDDFNQIYGEEDLIKAEADGFEKGKKEERERILKIIEVIYKELYSDDATWNVAIGEFADNLKQKINSEGK